VVPRDGESVYRGDLARLVRKVNEARGLDLSQYRESYLERRLATRLRNLRLDTYRQYARQLDRDPEEYQHLLDTLTINVTDFFRDPKVYEIFTHTVVPRIIDYKSSRRQRLIRAWSAGCATGEESYSIVMAILNVLGPSRRNDFLVSVLGTDIDQKVLDSAKIAKYPNEQLAKVPRAYKQFLDMGDKTFHVKEDVRKLVKFRQLNLFEDNPIHMVDIIFCRNVFIYFTRQQQEKVLEGFWSALHRGGYLVLGRSEKLSPKLAGRLELVDGRHRVYRKPR